MNDREDVIGAVGTRSELMSEGFVYQNLRFSGTLETWQ